MTSETTNNPSGTGPVLPGLPPAPRRPKVSPRLISAGIVAAVLAVGAAGGAGADRYIQKTRPQGVLLLLPAPIAQMIPGPVAVRGQVAEIFGNKFIIQDDSGRTLADTGPRGEGGKLVAKGETVTIQGHFEHGFIHANVMTRADGTSEAFGQPNHPRSEHGPDDRPGLHSDRGAGSDRGHGREPPPPRPEH
jgi:hypothetical protein